METYVVKAKNRETGITITDKFYCESPQKAERSFTECYRHGDYEILAVESDNSEKTITIDLTQDEWSTIYTALLLDLNDPNFKEHTETINKALTAVREWKAK